MQVLYQGTHLLQILLKALVSKCPEKRSQKLKRTGEIIIYCKKDQCKMQPHISLLWVQADTFFMVQLEVLLYKPFITLPQTIVV